MNRSKKQVSVAIMAITLVVIGGVPPIQAAGTKTWNVTAGDWFVDGNWLEGSYPKDGDDVIIAKASASVLLTNFTANLSSLTISQKLTFTNWNSALNATTVVIQSGGSLILPAVVTNILTSNNIYVVCSNLTIDGGGSINANAGGFAGGSGLFPGLGPGGGQTVTGGTGGSGGGYGSVGGSGGAAATLNMGGCSYGFADAPVDPGSGGGGGGSAPAGPGGHGGGAIRINASGTITVNGTITANGGAGTGSFSGGGSGGGIYLACNQLAGTNSISANGGGASASSYGGGGGGGRIAVIYTPAAQSAVPTVRFSAAPGVGTAFNNTKHGDLGTLYFPDNKFLTETIILPHIGQWISPGFTNWAPDTLTISNAWIRFPTNGFRLTVTNDVTIMGSSGKLELGGGSLWTNGAIFVCSDGVNKQVLDVGGNLTLTNGGTLTVYSSITNASSPDYGALVNVAKDVFIATHSWIYPYSHLTNGGSVLFKMRNLTVLTNGGFNADNHGYNGAWDTLAGYGPGGGGGSASLTGGGGGGYGGAGGNGSGSIGGIAYGSSNLPAQAGSGGGCCYHMQNYAGAGGGLVWIYASGTITLNGTITANGESSFSWRNGNGAGGGVYITCKKIVGSYGTISANGANCYQPSGGTSGGGGGGRIAVWRVFDETGGTTSNNVNFGVGGSLAGAGRDGVAGTVVWGWTPLASGTIFTIY